MYQFEIFAIKAAEKKELIRKYVIFLNHNLKNIPCYVMSEVSLKRFYFVLFDDGQLFEILKLAFIVFCIQTLVLLFTFTSG